MRTTINLEPDVYEFSAAYASGKGITLSAAISELIRRAEQAPEPGIYSSRIEVGPNGYLVIADSEHVLTPEMVKEASEDKLV
jgi:hypothetical protein